MIARPSAWRAYSASSAGSRVSAGAVADRLDDRAEVADRDALAQQRLQHALDLADARAGRARPPRRPRRCAP